MLPERSICVSTDLILHSVILSFTERHALSVCRCYNVGTNPNMLSGTFYPEYADWRKDAAGNDTIIKKYENG